MLNKSQGTVLNPAGLRRTSQRSLLLEIIREGKGHLDAFEIYQKARRKMPRISLSTVYRTLEKFKHMGLVDEVHFDEEHHHYEVRPAAEHHHLVCLKCGKVIEFQYPLIKKLKRDVPEARDFDITGAEVRIAGYCAKCRER